MIWRGGIMVTLLLAIVVFCLFEYVLHYQCAVFRGFEAALLSLRWELLASLAVWCGAFLYLTFSLNDLPLIGLLFIVICAYFFGTQSGLDTLMLFLGCVTLGKGVRFALKSGKLKAESANEAEVGNRSALTRLATILSHPMGEGNYFLAGLIVLLAFASWWHLDISDSYYHGPRWMGLWDNPNTYGMLMGTGSTLAIGLLAANAKLEIKNSKLAWFLTIAAGMMFVGLVMSYSRGAWLGMAVGLLYLAWNYGRLKWRFVVPGVVIVAAAAFYFWSSTADSAPWYVKRADLGRPSAQHRATAWRAGLEMMRDHPLGVGWNNAVTVYAKDYSPPENGAAAITTNDYLMLGTELGIPALLCFVTYIALCFRNKGTMQNDEDRIKTACRAGAFVLIVSFWFDGGLFKLPTAAVFWILLELGNGKAVESKHDQLTA